MLIDVSRVAKNPRLQQPLQIQRSTYALQNEGEWTQVSTATIDLKAVVTPTSAEDQIKYLPEGQRQLNAITIFSPVQIMAGNGKDQVADVILWNGSYYRVQFSKPYQVYGYYFAIATGFVHA